MQEKLEKLRRALEAEQERLRKANGKSPRFSSSGPVSLTLVKALIAVVEAQAQRQTAEAALAQQEAQKQAIEATLAQLPQLGTRFRPARRLGVRESGAASIGRRAERV